jgi:hypothetical protein
MRLTDRLGERYERLVVIERAPNKSAKDTNARWLCQCDCGKTAVVYGQDLAKGKQKSCGCLNAERITTHGRSRTHAYRAWQGMLQRCENPNMAKFSHYGGRGITVCERWHDYANFLADMGDRPIGYTIDRIDNNGNYEPGNCRWATYGEQNNNNRRNHLLTLNGQTHTVTEWAAITGIGRPTLFARIRYGWSDERILTEPVG